MVVTDLLIKAKNGTDSFKYYPIAKNIPINLTFALADVRDPDKRKASFSKTIELYGTNEINKLFENIFSFNVATQSFNKNLKSPCKYIVDGIENFSGDLQLLKVNIKPDNSIIYECSIVGDSGSIFVDIGDKLIIGNTDSAEDLDFSAYDHTYNRATQISSRANLGSGLDVLYPFVNKGSNGGSDTVFNVSDFLPCFSLYEYIKKIIENTGRTFTSTFLESSFFKHLIVYPNITEVLLSLSQLAERQFYVGLSANQSFTVGAIAIPVLDVETAPFFDTNNIYNNAVSNAAVIQQNGFYNVANIAKIKYWLEHSDPTVVRYEFASTQPFSVITKSTDSGATFPTLASGSIGSQLGLAANIDIAGALYFNVGVATGQVFLNVGDIIRPQVSLTIGAPPVFYNAANVVVTTGTFTRHAEIVGGTTETSFYCLSTVKSVSEGNPILVNNSLPTKIKQKDLLKSTLLAFNLFVEPDKDDVNNLIIEPFDAFYNTLPVVDFGNRTDLDKDQTVNPNILDGKRYIYSYKDDKDYYNVLYKESYNETFGTEQIDVENDFIKSDKKTELIFSATPNVANYDLGIAYPKIFAKEDSGIIKPVTPNIRLLYCDEKTTQVPYTYKEYNQTDLVTSDYLYAGHTDDPFNPTLDLNFGFPKEVYYSFPNAYFTDNNLYNAYHKQYLTNLIDRDGKFVTKYLWLSPKDIYSFSFRNRIFVDGAYYIVNKIENYNPIEEDSTKCELIKLLDTPVFTPTSYRLSDTTINTGGGILTTKLNSSLNVGDGIQNKGTNCVAIGNNIIIPESCSNVTIIGNNVVVSEDVSNSSVINTNDFELTQSNYSVTNSATSLLTLTGEQTTTNNTPTQILFNTGTGEFTLENNSIYKVYSKVLAVDIASGDYKEWEANGIATDYAATVNYTASMAVTSTLSTGSMSGCNLIISGMPTEQLNYSIAGLALTTIKWSCEVQYIKINI